MYKSQQDIIDLENKQSKAILFLNSNKSAENINEWMHKIRQKCYSFGIDLQHECVVNKGPDRDIDREAINLLIVLLISHDYKVVVVNHMIDLTDDLSDLDEFVKDAGAIGVRFFELSTMNFYYQRFTDNSSKGKDTIWDGGTGC